MINILGTSLLVTMITYITQACLLISYLLLPYWSLFHRIPYLQKVHKLFIYEKQITLKRRAITMLRDITWCVMSMSLEHGTIIYIEQLMTLDKLVHCPDNNSKQTSLTTACGELDVASWHVLYDIIIRQKISLFYARGKHVKCDKIP